MKCEEVQDLLIEYTDNLLPEVTRRRVAQHLAGCKSCRADYEVWTESSKWIQADKDQSVQSASTKSIVDAVMARILSEEKWAIPIGKKVFTLTARMRRIGASAAVILLMLCGFTLFANSHQQTDMAGLDIPTSSKAEVVSSSIESPDGVVEVVSEPSPASNSPVASIAPVAVDDSHLTVSSPNYSLILSFFGILITVIGMSWMMRA